MSAAKLADKLFFRFGGQPPSGGLSVRSQFTEARDGATQPRAQLGQVSHLRGVFLRGGHGQVGKVKTRPVLVQGWDDVGNGSLLGVEEVGGKGQSREREARVYEALRRRHLGDGGPGDRSSQTSGTWASLPQQGWKALLALIYLLSACRSRVGGHRGEV